MSTRQKSRYARGTGSSNGERGTGSSIVGRDTLEFEPSVGGRRTSGTTLKFKKLNKLRGLMRQHVYAIRDHEAQQAAINPFEVLTLYLNQKARLEVAMGANAQAGHGGCYEVTGPFAAKAFLRRLGTKHAEGSCSKMTPLSLGKADLRERAGIPSDAHFYSFLYPLEQLNEQRSRLLRDRRHESWLLLLLFGGFAYFDASKACIQTNALSLGDAKGSDADPATLIFERHPDDAAAGAAAALLQSRLTNVTSDILLQTGYRSFAWVGPDEPEPELKALTNGRGSFVYSLADSTFTSYRLSTDYSLLTRMKAKGQLKVRDVEALSTFIPEYLDNFNADKLRTFVSTILLKERMIKEIYTLLDDGDDGPIDYWEKALTSRQRRLSGRSCLLRNRHSPRREQPGLRAHPHVWRVVAVRSIGRWVALCLASGLHRMIFRIGGLVMSLSWQRSLRNSLICMPSKG